MAVAMPHGYHFVWHQLQGHATLPNMHCHINKVLSILIYVQVAPVPALYRKGMEFVLRSPHKAHV